MDFKDHPIDAASEAWRELCASLAIACGKSSGKLECRQTGDFEFMVKQVEPPRTLRLEYSPNFRRLRYNSGVSGWQELHVVKRPLKPVMFETPYHQSYTVEELGKNLLELLGKSLF